jgi:hypothetical protein
VSFINVIQSSISDLPDTPLTVVYSIDKVYIKASLTCIYSTSLVIDRVDFSAVYPRSSFLINPASISDVITGIYIHHVDKTQACRLLGSTSRSSGSIPYTSRTTYSSTHWSSDSSISNGWKCNFSQNSRCRDLGPISQENKGMPVHSIIRNMLMGRLWLRNDT